MTAPNPRPNGVRAESERYRGLGLWTTTPRFPPDALARLDRQSPDVEDLGYALYRGSGGELAFQQVDRLERTTWPTHDVPMQMHLDFTVSSLEELERALEQKGRRHGA